MYKVKVTLVFSAAHFLRGYKGKCEELHGHNWKVEAVVSSEQLDSIGLVMDFKELRSYLGNILERFDHKLLNDLEYFKGVNPTSESIAEYIFNELKKVISGDRKVEAVHVWEKDSSCATYQE